MRGGWGAVINLVSWGGGKALEVESPLMFILTFLQQHKLLVTNLLVGGYPQVV